MKKDRIFIHIPKTGGTTLECAIKGTKWMSNSDSFLYRHIIHETRSSNAGDIFHPSNFDKYSEYQIYTMLRHPVDRLISEYYFLKDRKEYFSLLKGTPKNLVQYAKHPQTKNSILNFLNGGRMYPKKPVTKSDLSRITSSIDNLNILVAIFEEFEKSISYFEKELKIKIPKQIDVKRITLNRPSLDEVDAETRKIIVENNALDIQLYDHCKAKFDQLNVKNKNLNIQKDKYSYVMKYTERFNLMTLYSKSIQFKSRNAKFFNDLNVYLHQQIPFENGKDYVNNWNKILVHAIQDKRPNGSLDAILSDKSEEDPLLTTEKICQYIDSKSKLDTSFTKILLQFNPLEIHVSKTVKKPSSFIGKLFGRK